ncbi:Os08g0471850 [Oryza sativa Japonica Group]|uniref:Os08g0471850 protein n=1 Tax=Oryza sativa subsp. japonica TaxID=39947 RepID=A0A0P0XGY9_ORYSJ|nr:hypothetical protein EE612_044844 [Oryza sativa]BAT05849.1 Os08g0471850 [Oryza sativa Japonica Group]
MPLLLSSPDAPLRSLPAWLLDTQTCSGSKTPARKGEFAVRFPTLPVSSKYDDDETDEYGSLNLPGGPRGPLLALGRRDCGIEVLPSALLGFGLKIHLSASSHFEGNVLPVLCGNTMLLPECLLWPFEDRATLSELQPC